MKKIMFNDRFGLTQAVLEGRKTMTRRIVTYPLKFRGENVAGYFVCRRPSGEIVEVCLHDEDERMIDGGQIFPKFEVGEIVAIAQNYRDSGYAPDSLDRHPKDLSIRGLMKDSAGWNNKMFVKSYACKHHIKITNVKVERLQDISDEDCLKEGIYEDAGDDEFYLSDKMVSCLASRKKTETFTPYKFEPFEFPFAVKCRTINQRVHKMGDNDNYVRILRDGMIARIRRLTPTECARLQTIPDWYKWECSDTQQYRMLGNGWTVDVIAHILSFMKEKMNINVA